MANALLLLARNTFKSRWMVVVAGFFIMSMSGSIYAFGVYSGALKKSLHYNQKTLTTVGFFKDFGNIGILAGLIADLAPPWVVLSIGVAFNTVGYLMIWLSVTKRIARPALWQMYLYITIGGNSIAFTHAGALVTCVKDFPLHRGMIVGLLKGFLGLSAAMLTLLYHAIYGDDPSSFILLITYLPFAVILTFMFFIRHVPVPKGGKLEDEVRVFYKLLAFELLMAGYLMLVIVIQHTAGVKQVANKAFGSIMVAILCIPLGLVVFMEAKKLRTALPPREDDVEMVAPPPVVVAEEKNPKEEEEDKNQSRIRPQDSPEDDANAIVGGSTDRSTRIAELFKTPRIGRDFTIWQALVHPDFWMLSIASTGGLGAGLMLIDNLGQVGTSFGYDTDKTSTFVSLISIWNCLGRVGSGFVSEAFLQRYGLARPFFLALAQGISAVGYLTIALGLPGSLFVGSILIGLCFGAQWSLLHIIVSEVFGLKYYGTLQSIIGMASPLGTYLLSVRVAGFLYDQESERQRAAAGSGARAAEIKLNNSCKGTVCYRTTFFVMCAVCSFGCLLLLLMTARTRRFYKEEVYEKLKASKIEMIKSREEPAAYHLKDDSKM